MKQYKKQAQKNNQLKKLTISSLIVSTKDYHNQNHLNKDEDPRYANESEKRIRQ